MENVNNVIAAEIEGLDALDQVDIDTTLIELDGTENKAKLGANAILGVSMATARAAADFLGVPLFKYLGPYHATVLPVPMANIINGGSHADNSVDFQEFMVMPVGAETFREAVRMTAEIFHTLKGVLGDKGYSTAVGDEGGFAPNLKSNEEACEVILQAIDGGLQGRRPGHARARPRRERVLRQGKGQVRLQEVRRSRALGERDGRLLGRLGKQVPHHLHRGRPRRDDWEGWKALTDKIGDKVQLVGDDLFVTNTKRLKKGIDQGVANSILVKVNQIGTLTETYEAVEMAKRASYTAIVSHRSGETEDSFIADLVVALETGQIKTGSMSRSDRLAKYNQLMRIEDMLETTAKYAGREAFYSIKM